MVLKNIFKRSSPEQMRSVQEKVKQALLKLEASPIDDQVKKILRDRFQETTERYESLYATQGISQIPEVDETSPEVDENITDVSILNIALLNPFWTVFGPNTSHRNPESSSTQRQKKADT